MAQTASLQIDRLTVTGFGCFAEEHSWDFGRMTTITGHNFQGKSTIADAIAYALTGAPFFGGRQDLHDPEVPEHWKSPVQDLNVPPLSPADWSDRSLKLPPFPPQPAIPEYSPTPLLLPLWFLSHPRYNGRLQTTTSIHHILHHKSPVSAPVSHQDRK